MIKIDLRAGRLRNKRNTGGHAPSSGSGGSTGGQGGTHPPEIFFALSLASPTFLERYKILNFEFTANICELGRCTRNEHDISKLLLYFNLYKTSL